MLSLRKRWAMMKRAKRRNPVVPAPPLGTTVTTMPEFEALIQEAFRRLERECTNEAGPGTKTLPP
jgi:hypothetical protein